MPDPIKKPKRKLLRPLRKKKAVAKPKVFTPLANGLLSLEDSVAKAIQTIKESDYKGLYIKVELEAQMNRDWDEDDCEQWIEDHVSDEAKKALVYGRFYDDGSVDSEFTFTVPIDNPYVVIEYINAFKELSHEAGNGLQVDGAGMHIAILNSKDGNYSNRQNSDDGNKLSPKRTANFAASMTSLLPALYFLGTSDARSRGLGFREPVVCKNNYSRGKYQAISHMSQVFEYRVFDTCYDKPEAFLDYLCVIAKSLQFYKLTKVTMPFFGKIGQLVFPDEGYHLSRFYQSIKHLEALNLGLAILKPDHKSIEQLKKERSFDIDDKKLAEADKKLTLKWQAEYDNAKKLFNQTVERKKTQLGQYYDSERNYGNTFDGMAKDVWIKREIDRWLKTEFDYMETPDKFVDKKKQEVLQRGGRSYVVNV